MIISFATRGEERRDAVIAAMLPPRSVRRVRRRAGFAMTPIGGDKMAIMRGFIALKLRVDAG
jgi:hypothetical protein